MDLFREVIADTMLYGRYLSNVVILGSHTIVMDLL